MAKLKAGTIAELQVERDSQFGFFLSNGETDVLLHTSEAGEGIQIGSMIEVYLYHDHENRLAATLKKPILKLEENGKLSVVDVNPTLGVFLENGTPRNVLLPKSELPRDTVLWPMAGDELFVYIGHDKQGRLLAYLLNDNDLADLSNKADTIKVNEMVHATVTRVGELGAFFVTEDMVMGMVHRSELTRELRLGEKVDVRVTFIREDGRINASMRLPKEQSRDVDADRIYDYIKAHGGSMPYGDKSTPEEIEATFRMSKAAFKRALGKLMKARLVYQKDGTTYLL